MAIINNQMLWRQFGAAIDTLGDALLLILLSSLPLALLTLREE
ncbi:MAG: hypothetical protein WAM60_26830 [Candidatus Promineifilaceae bacterium]